jgi:hypothetical protein
MALKLAGGWPGLCGEPTSVARPGPLYPLVRRFVERINHLPKRGANEA